MVVVFDPLLPVWLALDPLPPLPGSLPIALKLPACAIWVRIDIVRC